VRGNRLREGAGDFFVPTAWVAWAAIRMPWLTSVKWQRCVPMAVGIAARLANAGERYWGLTPHALGE